MPEIRPYGAQCDECGKCLGENGMTDRFADMRLMHTEADLIGRLLLEGWYIDGRHMVCPDCRPDFEARKAAGYK